MLPIYAILLFLQQLVSSGSYTQPQMDAIISNNQTMITILHNDPIQQSLITQQYGADAQVIITNNHDLMP